MKMKYGYAQQHGWKPRNQLALGEIPVYLTHHGNPGGKIGSKIGCKDTVNRKNSLFTNEAEVALRALASSGYGGVSSELLTNNSGPIRGRMRRRRPLMLRPLARTGEEEGKMLDKHRLSSVRANAIAVAAEARVTSAVWMELANEDVKFKMEISEQMEVRTQNL